MALLLKWHITQYEVAQVVSPFEIYGTSLVLSFNSASVYYLIQKFSDINLNKFHFSEVHRSMNAKGPNAK